MRHSKRRAGSDGPAASGLRGLRARLRAEGAALLVDHVLPAVGYRQWVLCLVTDGAYEEQGGELRFLPAAPPTPERMTAVLAQVL